eukprot:1161858-Pelagomonas_calceolata.AAC.3
MQTLLQRHSILLGIRGSSSSSCTAHVATLDTWPQCRHCYSATASCWASVAAAARVKRARACNTTQTTGRDLQSIPSSRNTTFHPCGFKADMIPEGMTLAFLAHLALPDVFQDVAHGAHCADGLVHHVLGLQQQPA